MNPCLYHCNPQEIYTYIGTDFSSHTVCSGKSKTALWRRHANPVCDMESPIPCSKQEHRTGEPSTLSALLSLSYSLFNISILQRSPEHKEGADWRKAVPSYTQSSSTMDFRTWSSLPRDDSLEPLPFNWEMAYTETGMVYFIE